VLKRRLYDTSARYPDRKRLHTIARCRCRRRFACVAFAVIALEERQDDKMRLIRRRRAPCATRREMHFQWRIGIRDFSSSVKNRRLACSRAPSFSQLRRSYSASLPTDLLFIPIIAYPTLAHPRSSQTHNSSARLHREPARRLANLQLRDALGRRFPRDITRTALLSAAMSGYSYRRDSRIPGRSCCAPSFLEDGNGIWMPRGRQTQQQQQQQQQQQEQQQQPLRAGAYVDLIGSRAKGPA